MARNGPGQARLNVELMDEPLFDAIKIAAIRRHQPLRLIVKEALEQWLERQEDEDDRRVIEERRNEERVPWEQVKAEMRRAREAQDERA